MTLQLRIDQKDYQIPLDKYQIFDDFSLEPSIEHHAGYTVVSCYLHPKKDIIVQAAEVKYPLPAALQDKKIVANGYQSWSETFSTPQHKRIKPLRWLAKSQMQHYGDTEIKLVKNLKNAAHSWSWIHIGGHDAWFAGSIAEHTGFTLFSVQGQSLLAQKELDMLKLGHSFQLFHLVITDDNNPSAAISAFFRMQNAKQRPVPKEKALGWTSWYQFGPNISSGLLLKHLDGVADSGLPFRYFQLDDGWQKATGDWLVVDDVKFPEGLQKIRNTITAKGLIPGIWLAPLVLAANSKTYQQHPDWVLQDAKGKPIKAGVNKGWGGDYFALNFYHPAAREYLAGVLYQAVKVWGFRLLKLDFLFAACIAPPSNKTRGQVMHEVMEFIHKAAEGAEILACGVPLSACIGLTDYCRIGGDVHTEWQHKLATLVRHRERVGTLETLRSTLNRFWLHGHAWSNDPDVFILRPEGQKLTPTQQYTLLTVNALFGGLLFTSDHPEQWSDEARCELEAALALAQADVLDLNETHTDVFVALIKMSGQKHQVLINLSAKPMRIGTDVHLEPFETLILRVK